MVGKLTRHDKASSSIIYPLMGYKGFLTKQQILDNCIKAKNGIPNEFIQTNRQRTGDLLEYPLIIEACARLGLINVNADVNYKVEHPFLPLEASMDGIAEADNLIVEPNENIGIYIPHGSKYKMTGKVVIECKCSSNFPDPVEPPQSLGVIQLQSTMEIVDAEYGVLIVLYQSTDLRIYVYKRNPEFAKKLEKVVVDFDRRVQEEEYFMPEITADAYIKNPEAIPDEVKILSEQTENYINQLLATKDMIKKLEVTADSLQAQIMDNMGNASEGRIGDHVVHWKMRSFKARPEKVVPAKDAYEIRSKTLTIKQSKGK